MLFHPTYGLTLGGGGARGGAHIGALRILAEAGYRPDIIVGSSIGGWIAALLGIGWSTRQMEDFFTAERFGEMIYLDRTGGGLLGIDRFEDELKRIFADADLRDLSPQVAVMAADINRHHRILVDRGPVHRALIATIAVPGVFPALACGDMLLVDGGVNDNLPTQATYHLGADRVVAIDLDANPEAGMSFGDHGTFSKYFERAFYWLLDLSKRQRAFETVAQAYRLSYQTLTQYQVAIFPPDVLIRPDMPDIGLFSMEHIPDAIRAGEQAARDRRDDLKKIMRPFYFRRMSRVDGLPPLIRAGV